MANEVHLTIALPSQVFLETEVASVLLPAVRADVNILPERAPSVFTLDYGVLQILGRDGNPKERYFIKSGSASIADNKCMVLTSHIIPYDSITPYEAKKQVEVADNEDDRLFYQMILDYQRGVRRRYLRTLNVFADKSGQEKTHEEVVQDIREELEKLKQRSLKKK